MAWSDAARAAAAEARRRHSGGGIDPKKHYTYKQANRLYQNLGRPKGFALHSAFGKSGAMLKNKYLIRKSSY